MNTQASSVSLTDRVERVLPDEPFRLRGAWLALGRILFVALFILCVAMFATSLWRVFVRGAAPCDVYYANWEACPAFREAQTRLGLSPIHTKPIFWS